MYILGGAQGARLTPSALVPHIWFLPGCCIHLLGVFNSLVWFFPHPINLLTRPSCGWCTRSWSRGEALELHQRQGLTLTLDQNNGLSCQKALLQTGCAPVCTQVPPVLQAGSDPQPEKQNFKPGTALEFRQLNYLNFFKLLESLWKAGLFYHLSLAGMTSWWLPLSFWKAASIYLKKD